MAETEDSTPPKPTIKEMVVQYWPIILLVLFILQNTGLLSVAQVSEFRKLFSFAEQQQQSEEQKVEPTPEPPKPDAITPETIEEIIRKLLKETQEAKKEPKPTPAADDTPPPAPQPAPPAQAKIRLCDESGNELTDAAIEAGELFRVSAVNCGQEIGWHPVESGDVKLSASTDGKEYCGYLDAGQWVEFSLTDFASKTQASLRVTCLTAPQPPPDPKPDDEIRPKPQPTAKNVRVYVVYNENKISPDAAIVLNANDMWDKFTADGNDWKFIDISTDDAYEKKIVADASGIGLPAIVVYDKASGKKLTAEELPKSVIATEGLIERYTGGGN
jgi:hypothetical protein